ncbi:MAG: spondin domain-containing protein [Acidobacteriota bacterium]
MHRSLTRAVLLFAIVSLAVASTASAQLTETYRITFTNITRAQVISPPVVATHSIRASIFNVGEPASPELAGVAEDAMNDPLVAALDVNPEVHRVLVAGDGPIPPGESVTIEIEATSEFPRLSAVGMLVQTNDAFFGVDTFALLGGPWRKIVMAPAYDAGSEENNELCAFIPGPPCGSAGVRATDNAEGFVYISNGMHGLADDLPPERYDWRNPVMQVTIIRTATTEG